MSRNGKWGGRTTAKQRLPIRQLMNTRRITEYSLETYDGDGLMYFMIRLTNLSVLSEPGVGAGVYALMSVFKGVAEIEMLCLDNWENLEENRGPLHRRTEEERNPVIRQLLERDQNFLDQIQVQIATIRGFLILIWPRNQKGKDVFSCLNRIEKFLEEQGSDSRRADGEGIKRILAVHYEQNVTGEKFGDSDGTRWIIPDD